MERKSLISVNKMDSVRPLSDKGREAVRGENTGGWEGDREGPTQRQRRQTVWRKEAGFLRSRGRADGWAQERDDTASRLGSAAYPFSYWRERHTHRRRWSLKHDQSQHTYPFWVRLICTTQKVRKTKRSLQWQFCPRNTIEGKQLLVSHSQTIDIKSNPQMRSLFELVSPRKQWDQMKSKWRLLL